MFEPETLESWSKAQKT